MPWNIIFCPLCAYWIYSLIKLCQAFPLTSDKITNLILILITFIGWKYIFSQFFSILCFLFYEFKLANDLIFGWKLDWCKVIWGLTRGTKVMQRDFKSKQLFSKLSLLLLLLLIRRGLVILIVLILVWDQVCICDIWWCLEFHYSHQRFLLPLSGYSNSLLRRTYLWSYYASLYPVFVTYLGIISAAILIRVNIYI